MTMIKETNGDIFALYNAICALLGDSKVRLPSKFNYALAKNKKTLQATVEALQETVNKRAPEFIQFDAARVELCHKYAVKDEKGQPVVDEKNNFKIDDQVTFDTELVALKEKYQKAIDEELDRQNKLKDLINMMTEVDIHKIKLSDIGNEPTVPSHIEYLMPMIDDSEV